MLETQVTTTCSNLNEFFKKNQGDIEVTAFYPLLVRKDLRFCAFYKRTLVEYCYTVDLVYPEAWDEFHSNHKDTGDVVYTIPVALPHYQKHVFIILRKKALVIKGQPAPKSASNKLPAPVDDHRVDAIASAMMGFPPEMVQSQLASLGNQALIDQVREKVSILQNRTVDLSGSKNPAIASAPTSVAVFGGDAPSGVTSVISPVKPSLPVVDTPKEETPAAEASEEDTSVVSEKEESTKGGKKKRGRPKHD